MSPAEELEFWRVMVPVIGLAAGSLIATIIHAWASAMGRQENREQNQRIESKVSELQGQIESRKENSDGKPC